jgi:imidazolonepropionase-like amidohydrolase
MFMQQEEFMTHPIAIQHARIFDGSAMIASDTVVVQDGLIAAVGDERTIPVNAQITDATGQTLLPGLIDAHTHIIFGQSLKEALIFGVTTELDMFSDYHVIAELKQQQATDAGQVFADLRSAGTLTTAPGGHGTEYGIPIPTIHSPDEAQEFVDARIAEGSDYIKIIYDDGRAYARSIPTIDKATMAAVVEAAHRRNKLAIAHILTLQDARDAIEVGADGLAHLFFDRLPDPDFGRFVAEHHAFVIPTFTVLEGFGSVPSGTSLVTDSRLAPYLVPTTIGFLQSAFPLLGKEVNDAIIVESRQQLVGLLKAAGVPILAGTDAPNPGTAHGVSIHRELELLVQGGLTPCEALAAATSVPADIFGLSDRGRIAPGLRADLVLVTGDPSTTITQTRDIAGIWKRGIPIDRQSYRESVEQQRRESEHLPAPEGSESGLISDFENGTTGTVFGHGWDISTDRVRGGASTAQYTVVPEGANGGKGSLLITGEVAPGSTFGRWAGATFFPGFAPWTPANLSAKKGVDFWAKGDGKTYSVTIFTRNSMMPASVPFEAGAEWQHFRFPFTQFKNVDGRDLLCIQFLAGSELGPFAFQIDDVRLFS